MGGSWATVDLRLPFVAAGSLALLNLPLRIFVLPESLPADRRRALAWKSMNPVSSLRGLAQLKGGGAPRAVVACSGSRSFVLYTSWVLYTTFKFGWAARDGWSLAAVASLSAVVQGLLLGRILKRVSRGGSPCRARLLCARLRAVGRRHPRAG